jgi:hypothetical protein
MIYLLLKFSMPILSVASAINIKPEHKNKCVGLLFCYIALTAVIRRRENFRAKRKNKWDIHVCVCVCV